MRFLVDHNLGRHTTLLLGTLLSSGWLSLLSVTFTTFAEVKLPIDSDDRIVWRFAQENQMILLTANRSMKGDNSLEQVMREEITSVSLPVITIGDAERFLNDSSYRGRCAARLMEILIEIDNYRGVTRLFLP